MPRHSVTRVNEVNDDETFPLIDQSINHTNTTASAFGTSVYEALRDAGHTITGVFTVADKNGKADPIATAAEKDGVTVIKVRRSSSRNGQLSSTPVLQVCCLCGDRRFEESGWCCDL